MAGNETNNIFIYIYNVCSFQFPRVKHETIPTRYMIYTLVPFVFFVSFCVMLLKAVENLQLNFLTLKLKRIATPLPLGFSGAPDYLNDVLVRPMRHKRTIFAELARKRESQALFFFT